jgi:RNA polymerase sigma-70 factor
MLLALNRRALPHFREMAARASRDVAAPLLELVLSEGAHAWPGVRLEPDRVRAFLAERTAQCTSTSRSRAADLYLVCACLCGDAQAVRALESLCRDEVRYTTRQLRATVDEDDAVASLVSKLLVAEHGAEPKIGQYSGQSELHRWIQVAVVRHVLNSERPHSREVPLTEAILEDIESANLPEWRSMEVSAREAFKAALAKALGDLSLQDRNLLRHRLDGLLLAEIASLYKLNEATVSRRLARAGTIVEQAALCELRGRLRLNSSEIGSLVRSLLSQVNSSMRAEVSCALRGGRE